MAKIKFENTYELLKYMVLKGRLESYCMPHYGDVGAGVFPEILNGDIEGVIDELYNFHWSWFGLDDHSDSEETVFKLYGDELYGDIVDKTYSSEYDDMDLYPELIVILKKVRLIKDENEIYFLECTLDNSESFLLKKLINGEDSYTEIKVDIKQRKAINSHLTDAFYAESTTINEDSSIDNSTICLTINSEETAYSAYGTEDSISVKEHIDFMIQFNKFEDQSYEFEEEELK
jgi:hypothetical protein